MIGAHLPELPDTYLSALDDSVAAAFERAAALHAGSIAVSTHSETLTYAAINRAANRLAHAILARRGASEEPIAFVADRPSVVLTCLLASEGRQGVRRADPAHPSSRLQAVCADAARL
jgi:non-ribosomal peptide synthetase component F